MARGGGAGGRSGGGFRGGSFHSGGFHGSRHGSGSEMGCVIRIIAVMVCLIAMLVQAIAGRQPVIHYSEEALEHYAAEQYVQCFGEGEASEDNLLLTVVVWPDRRDYSYIAWVGDHISDTTFALLGGNDTLLGRTMESEIAYGYGLTLSGDLERVLELLAEGICAASPEGSYTCSEDHAASGSWLVNNSNISLHESRMNNALAAFTGATGIPIVLVIVEAEDIF